MILTSDFKRKAIASIRKTIVCLQEDVFEGAERIDQAFGSFLWGHRRSELSGAALDGMEVELEVLLGDVRNLRNAQHDLQLITGSVSVRRNGVCSMTTMTRPVTQEITVSIPRELIQECGKGAMEEAIGDVLPAGSLVFVAELTCTIYPDPRDENRLCGVIVSLPPPAQMWIAFARSEHDHNPMPPITFALTIPTAYLPTPKEVTK
jgi:hypothetical protein